MTSHSPKVTFEFLQAQVTGKWASNASRRFPVISLISFTLASDNEL